MNTFTKFNTNPNTKRKQYRYSLQSEIKYKRTTKHSDILYQNDSTLSNNKQNSFNTITTPLFAKGNNKHHQHSRNNNNSSFIINHKKLKHYHQI